VAAGATAGRPARSGAERANTCVVELKCGVGKVLEVLVGNRRERREGLTGSGTNGDGGAARPCWEAMGNPFISGEWRMGLHIYIVTQRTERQGGPKYVRRGRAGRRPAADTGKGRRAREEQHAVGVGSQDAQAVCGLEERGTSGRAGRWGPRRRGQERPHGRTRGRAPTCDVVAQHDTPLFSFRLPEFDRE
jgi:hypothetical protein